MVSSVAATAANQLKQLTAQMNFTTVFVTDVHPENILITWSSSALIFGNLPENMFTLSMSTQQVCEFVCVCVLFPCEDQCEF